VSTSLRTGAVLLVTAAALAGCADGKSVDAHRASAQDALFGDYMTAHHLTRYGDPGKLRSLAHQLCSTEAAGTPPEQAVGTVTDAGLTTADAGQFATAAATVYCPQYANGFSLLDPLNGTP
jgi:Protein of unknown function (DUF732)